MPAWHDNLFAACVAAKKNGQANFDMTGVPGCQGGTTTVSFAGNAETGGSKKEEQSSPAKAGTDGQKTDGVGKGEMASCFV
jgi:hypothetical protein